MNSPTDVTSALPLFNPVAPFDLGDIVAKLVDKLVRQEATRQEAVLHDMCASGAFVNELSLVYVQSTREWWVR